MLSNGDNEASMNLYRSLGFVEVMRSVEWSRGGCRASATGAKPRGWASVIGPDDPGVYEVFRQEKDGEPMRHAGNVRAPDIDLATHYAREFYGRRQESVRLWIVARADIRDLSDPDLLQPAARSVVQEARRLRDARQARRPPASVPRKNAETPNERGRGRPQAADP